jgi:hypothetical protein
MCQHKKPESKLLIQAAIGRFILPSLKGPNHKKDQKKQNKIPDDGVREK